MSDNAVDFEICQVLRDRRSLLRIGLVVFGHQFEANLLAADAHASRLESFDGQASAALGGFPQVRDRAAGWPDVANVDASGTARWPRAMAARSSMCAPQRNLPRATPA